MTVNKKFKQQVRARMVRTGEGYQKALIAIREGKPEPALPPPASKAPEPEAEDRELSNRTHGG